MKIGIRSIAAAAATTGLLLAGIVPAHAATKTITVWADDQRGPQLETLIDGNTQIVPGYTIKVKFYASLTALQEAWNNASASGGPDVLTGPASFTLSAKSGKLLPLTYSSRNKKELPAASVKALSYKSKAYGVALDVDTTAMFWNKKFGSVPTTIKAMYDLYVAKKAAGAVDGGICAFEGTWGSHPVLTALGGGAFGYKGSAVDAKKVLINSSALKANFKKYLVGSDGKSNGFFKWDNCADSFKNGRMLAANTGAWNLSSIKETDMNYTIGAVPGLTKSTKGAQWVNYSAAYVTKFASSHGVATGAKSLVLKWFASQQGQYQMYVTSKRPPANVKAAALVSSKDTKAFSNAAATGTPQFSDYLDNKAGGANWYDTLGDVYDKILNKGQAINSTLDAAAAILKNNFAAAAAGN